MVSFDDDRDANDWRNDPDASAPPTSDEVQQMLEAISVMQAVSLLRDRGYAVVEPVEIEGGAS